MSYIYKKEFLGQWMRENGITPYALMDVLGVKSVNNIMDWAGIKPKPRGKKTPKEDDGWLPLVHILKICNTQGLPLSSFIENAEDEPAKKVRKKGCAGLTEADEVRYLKRENELLNQVNSLHEQLGKARDQIVQLQAQLAEARKPGTERHGLSDEKGATASGRITVEP